MKRRLRLGDEHGIALVMALGFVIVISITLATLIEYSSSNSRSVSLSKARLTARTIAEAGLNEAYAILSNASDPRSPTALPAGGSTYEGGSVSWSGTVNGDTWSVTATSTVKNPTGSADVKHTVNGQIRIGVDGTGYAPAWQYVYADSLTTCTIVQNNADISAPFYIRGDLCLKNSAMLTNSKITVKGKITLENSSSIGKSTAYISELHVGTSGCSNTTSGHTFANCDPAHRVYANSKDSTFANIAKPSIDLTYYYNYAKPGPKNNCTTGSFPGGFDNPGNTVMDRSLPAVTLLPASSYECVVTSGSSTLGKIKWTAGAPGTLEISGIIFFDGDILIGGQARYTGRGTIYSSGKILFQNDDYLCGAANCAVDAWDGNTNMVIFVAGTVGDASGTIGFEARNSAKFQGGIYAVWDVKQMNSAVIEGPVIADQLYFENFSSAQNWPPIDFVADGAPAPIGSTKLIPVSGAYSG